MSASSAYRVAQVLQEYFKGESGRRYTVMTCKAYGLMITDQDLAYARNIGDLIRAVKDRKGLNGRSMHKEGVPAMVLQFIKQVQGGVSEPSESGGGTVSVQNGT